MKNRPTKPPQTLSVWAQSNHKHAHLPQNNQKATTKWYETTSEILSNQYELQQHHKKTTAKWQPLTKNQLRETQNICKMMWNKTRPLQNPPTVKQPQMENKPQLISSEMSNKCFHTVTDKTWELIKKPSKWPKNYENPQKKLQKEASAKTPENQNQQRDERNVTIKWRKRQKTSTKTKEKLTKNKVMSTKTSPTGDKEQTARTVKEWAETAGLNVGVFVTVIPEGHCIITRPWKCWQWDRSCI